MRFSSLRTVALAVAVGSVVLVGCTTTKETDTASAKSSSGSIDAQVDATLNRLYAAAPDARELVAKSAGVLVFPAVLGGSFVIGAEHGRGALRTHGRTEDYYSLSAGSVGWQIGAQSKAVIYVFNTKDALDKFRNSKGWVAGVDATVAVARIGVNGTIDSETVKQPVVGFVMNNAGLEAGVSLQGSKITKITP
ncbi:BPSL1445 family SYLF domain-containing lipoprotein [Polaromonas sp.]|uniref:BPSL1445 family SYLF domain-containing lipoprotein n=1 Tax=Polaromonas sp. TaxID=1869339 RepID=UPI001A33A31A|nr:twin-arginine translocation pathway signal [Burkholderiales bacterium]